jgi:hypothetical protein
VNFDELADQLFAAENARREAENERLRHLEETDPAAFCREKGHSWVHLEAPAMRVCRTCKAEVME